MYAFKKEHQRCHTVRIYSRFWYMNVHKSAPFDNRMFNIQKRNIRINVTQRFNSIPSLCYERFPEFFISTELKIESPQIIIR